MGTVVRVIALVALGSLVQGCSLNNTTETAALGANEAIKIITPNGGESYRVGDTLVVYWVIDKSKATNPLYVDLSIDAGKGFIALIRSADDGIKITDSRYQGNIGRFEWEIPDSAFDFDGFSVSIASEQCIVNINEMYASSSAEPWQDESDAVFTIAPAAVAPPIHAGREECVRPLGPILLTLESGLCLSFPRRRESSGFGGLDTRFRGYDSVK